MELLTKILVLSGVIWYLVDRFKGMWESVSFHSMLTSLFALVLSAFAVLSLKLDLLMAVGVYDTPQIVGYCFTALAFASGSSGISEILDKVGKKT